MRSTNPARSITALRDWWSCTSRDTRSSSLKCKHGAQVRLHVTDGLSDRPTDTCACAAAVHLAPPTSTAGICGESVLAWAPGFGVSKDVVVDVMHAMPAVVKGVINVAKGNRQPDEYADEKYAYGKPLGMCVRDYVRIHTCMFTCACFYMLCAYVGSTSGVHVHVYDESYECTRSHVRVYNKPARAGRQIEPESMTHSF